MKTGVNNELNSFALHKSQEQFGASLGLKLSNLGRGIPGGTKLFMTLLLNSGDKFSIL